MTHIELSLYSSASGPQLQRITVQYPSSGVQISSERGIATVGGAPTFSWSAGVRALTLLMIRYACFGDSARAALRGEAGSLAASLDYAMSKEPLWLLDMFGVDSKGRGNYKRLFKRVNPERRRPGPVIIFVNQSLLSSTDMQVDLDSNPVKTDRQLVEISKAIFDGGGRSPAFKRESATTPPRPVPNRPCDGSTRKRLLVCATVRQEEALSGDIPLFRALTLEVASNLTRYLGLQVLSDITVVSEVASLELAVDRAFRVDADYALCLNLLPPIDGGGISGELIAVESRTEVSSKSWLGESWAKSGFLKEATEWLVDELSLEPRACNKEMSVGNFEKYLRSSLLAGTNRRDDLEIATKLLQSILSENSDDFRVAALDAYIKWRRYFSGWGGSIREVSEATDRLREYAQVVGIPVELCQTIVRIAWDLGSTRLSLIYGVKGFKGDCGGAGGLVTLSRALMNAGHGAPALSLLQDALCIDPQNLTARKIEIWANLMVRNCEGALELYELHRLKFPGDGNTAWAGAVAALHLGSFERALEILNEALSSDQLNPPLWELLGYCLRYLGRERESAVAWAKGASICNALLKAAPENLRLLTWYGVLSGLVNREAACQEVCCRITRDAGTNGYLYFRLAQVYSVMNHFDEAIEALNKAWERGFYSHELAMSETLTAFSNISRSRSIQFTSILEKMERSSSLLLEELYPDGARSTGRAFEKLAMEREEPPAPVSNLQL